MISLSDYPILSRKHRNLVGISSSVPIEVLYAADKTVIDLNNIFITSPKNQEILKNSSDFAPATVCSWTRGVLASAILLKIPQCVVVTQGDCAHTIPMLDVLSANGVRTVAFEYPIDNDFDKLKNEINSFARIYGVNISEVEYFKEKFDEIRRVLKKIDELSYRDLKVGGFENHLYLISASDLNSDPDTFLNSASAFLKQASSRNAFEISLRIGHVGIPPIFSDYYDFISSLGSEIVFNETQRQFSLIGGIGMSVYEAYHNYTYPYFFEKRLNDIKEAIKERRLDCIIHYVQSFCFHQIEDRMLRSGLGDFPVLTLEGDYPAPLNENDKLKIESFVSYVEKKKHGKNVKHIAGCRLNKALVGIDLGSRSVKIACVENGCRKFQIYETMDFILKYLSGPDKAEAAGRFEKDLREDLGIKSVTIDYFSTGYGRYRAKIFSALPFSEIECHAVEAAEATGLKDFTLLDVGGQDIKTIEVFDGAIKGFSMNDKCAAGSGRYIENMARILKVDMDEISRYYENPEPLSITCATFGETEVIGKLIAGVDIKKIIAGINYTVYARVEPMLERHRSKSNTLVVTSGITNNKAFIKLLEANSGFSRVLVPENAQYSGAFGACLKGVSG